METPSLTNIKNLLTYPFMFPDSDCYGTTYFFDGTLVNSAVCAGIP